MFAGQRQDEIIRLLEKHGSITLKQLVEELGELQQALMKYWEANIDRDRVYLPDAEEIVVLEDHLAEEIADALIMIEQQVMLQDCAKAVARWKDEKIRRLREEL